MRRPPAPLSPRSREPTVVPVEAEPAPSQAETAGDPDREVRPRAALAPVARVARRDDTPATQPELTTEVGPVVHVSIGRVEVRAVRAEPPATPRRRADRPAPLVSLGDYLNGASP